MELTIDAVSIAALRPRPRPRYVGLSGLVAAIAVVPVIDTVNTSTGGAFALAAFGGFILWMLTSAIEMRRRPLLP